jgi:hypothetical protein
MQRCGLEGKDMSAAEVLRAAHAAGVTVMPDGENLMLEAKAQPPQSLLDALSRHKFAILALMRPNPGGWSAEYWRAYFDKRSAIAESNHGLPRAEAEARASACCVIEWLNQHPAPSAPGRCAWCGRPESPRVVVLPFGTEPGTHTWLHAECWPGWHQARRAEAIAALRAINIRK